MYRYFRTGHNKNLKGQLPWIVSFSFARAIQQPALDVWKGQESNVEEAQKLLLTRAKICSKARQGLYTTEMEQYE